MLERFSGIMVNILETLNDITKSEDNGVMTDSLIFVEGQSPPHLKDDLLLKGYCESEHEQRKKQLMLNDPVHNIVLKDYLQLQVSVTLFVHVRCVMSFLSTDIGTEKSGRCYAVSGFVAERRRRYAFAVEGLRNFINSLLNKLLGLCLERKGDTFLFHV